MRASAATASTSAAKYSTMRATERGSPTSRSRPTFQREWPDLELAERRQLLKAGLDAVILSRGRVAIDERAQVVWRGDGEEAPAAGGGQSHDRRDS